MARQSTRRIAFFSLTLAGCFVGEQELGQSGDVRQNSGDGVVAAQNIDASWGMPMYEY
ncbi:MAG: hypothetical protein JSU72_00505 [Deltaproteobacteria bacterium]|nr:MAG: hypothetical protein JSU72_00505 [Deltaproteobacteria bacterium]